MTGLPILPVTPIAATAGQPTDPSRRRILVVDDSFIMRKLVAEIVESDPDLEVAGFAENGKVALQMVRKLKPDLVLLDIEMPELSGLETLRRLGLRSPCPIVILSSLVGELDSAERQEALRLGAAATIGKPTGAVSLDLKQKRGSDIVRTVRAVLGMTPVGTAENGPAAPAVSQGSTASVEVAAVIEGLASGILLFDRSWRLIRANAEAARILRCPRPAPGTPMSAIFDDFNSGIAEDIVSATSTGPGLTAFEVDFAAEDGDWVPLRLNSRALDGDGGAYLVAFADISRERAVLALLAKTQSRSVADAIAGQSGLELGGEIRTATILFSDIRSFTSLSEALGPEGIVALLNDYFSFMADVIRDCGGAIDKFIGDAIMALFGVPTSTGQDADAAIAAARGMIRALDLLNERRLGAPGGAIRIGIGLATGEIIAGAIGSPDRMNYTVIGDAANLASRLESLTKGYGASILACGKTVSALQAPVPMRRVDTVRVKGQETPSEIWEIFAEEPEGSRAAALLPFAKGFDAYRAGRFTAAVKSFEAALELNPDDGAARLLAARCRKLVGTSDWDGVWTAEEK